MAKSKGPNPGFGGLFKNQYKEEKNHPDFTGSIALDDALLDAAEADGQLRVAGWKREDKNGNPFISLSIQKQMEKKDKSKKDDLDL